MIEETFEVTASLIAVTDITAILVAVKVDNEGDES